MSDQKLTKAQEQAQAALDKVMNCRFSNFDAGAVIHWAERGMYQLKMTDPAPEIGNFIPCPCTTFEQDEDCPVGFPSMLCSACEGKGVADIETVTALAAEMLKIAEQVDELEDPFAAWESIDLLKNSAPEIEDKNDCHHCKGKGCQTGDPEGAAIEPCYYCGGTGERANEMRLFGHWSKHRLADGVFLPVVCYVPTGPDYTTVPLYAPVDTPTLAPRDDTTPDIAALGAENERLRKAMPEEITGKLQWAMHDAFLKSKADTLAGQMIDVYDAVRTAAAPEQEEVGK